MAVFLFIVLFTHVSNGGSDSETLAALEVGCATNLAGLKFGTIGFERAVGTAPTLAAAINSQWTTRFATTGRCVFDGPRVYYDCVYSLEDLISTRTKIGEGRWKKLFVSGRVATDGFKTLVDNIDANTENSGFVSTSQLTPGTKPVSMFMEMPMELGKPGRLTPFLRDCRLARTGSEIENLSVISIAFSHDDAPTGMIDVRLRGEPKGLNNATRETRYRIDVNHGSIPVEMEEVVNSPRGRSERWHIHADIRQVGEGRWLPYRQLTYDVVRGSVEEVRLTQADFEVKPPESSYTIRYDVPRTIVDQIRKASYQKVRELNILRLPTNARSFKTAAINSMQEAPVMPGELEGGTTWRWTTAGLGMLLLAVSAILYRWRRARS